MLLLFLPCREVDLHRVWRYLNTESLENKVVYDLHSELQREADSCEGEGEGEGPHAAGPEAGCLKFDARFECGNLMRAVKVCCVRVCVFVRASERVCMCMCVFYPTHVQVQGNEYDLLLSSDINSDHYHHWFCFKVCVVPD